MTVSARRRSDSGPSWLSEVQRVDRAIYAAVAGTSTPRLDRAMSRVSRAANYSRLSIAAALILALLGGPRGRRAAASGSWAVAATSAFVNLVFKQLAGRHRPDRASDQLAPARQVRMPRSASFPSGHTASAVAFASAAGRELPAVSIPLHLLAALVGYSRVHTGVHYPGDVVAGAVVGAVIADLLIPVRARRSRSGTPRTRGR